MFHPNDEQLLDRVRALRKRKREDEAMLRILLDLGEIERRRLHLSLGYGSLFAFATRHLHYSESAAGRRVQAARCLRKHREVAAMLRRGELTLSTVVLVSSILDDANKETILDQARRKSQREVEALVVAYKPASRFRDRARRVNVAPAPSGLGEFLHAQRALAQPAPAQLTQPAHPGELAFRTRESESHRGAEHSRSGSALSADAGKSAASSEQSHAIAGETRSGEKRSSEPSGKSDAVMRE